MGGTTDLLTGGLQTIAGIGATAMGMPSVGIPLLTSGLSGMTGGTGGGSAGSMANMYAPGTTGNPTMNQIGQALQQNPLLSQINPNQVTGVSGQAPAAGTTQQNTLGAFGNTLNSIAPAAQQIMNAMGMNPQARPQQQQLPQLPQMPAMQRTQMPVSTGGAPPTMPQAAGTMVAQGGANPNAQQQLLAMLGLGQYA